MARAVVAGVAGASFGDVSGLGAVELLFDRGNNSSFLRANCGVEGAELVARMRL